MATMNAVNNKITNGSNEIILAGSFDTTLTTSGTTNVTLPVSGTLVNSAVATLSSLTSIGTIGTGVWEGTVVAGQYGGTGVANTGKAITLGGNLTTSGAYDATFTLTAATTVTFPTSGTLATTAQLGTFPATDVTGTTQALATNNAYMANNAALVTMTLPVTADFGTVIIISGFGAGGWLIAQNASQSIQDNSVSTTVGVGGSLASSAQYDQVTLFCAVADTTWVVTSSQGNLTAV